MNTILKCKFGSHLYGTNTPSSDLDYKGIFIPSLKDVILSKSPKTINENTKTNTNKKNTNIDVDLELFSLKYYTELLMQGQTVALDILFATQRPEMIVESSEIWNELYENRDKFFSNQFASYVNYAKSQAAKYGIRGSRVNACKIALDFFKTLNQNKKVLEYENEIYDNLKNVDFIEFGESVQQSGKVIKQITVCNRTALYTILVKDATAMFQRLFDEYGKRALAAANNEGVDWKACMHSVRISEQAIEFLQTGFIEFPRKNAKELIEIRLGNKPFKEVSNRIEFLLEEVQQQASKSRLPSAPNIEWIENFVYDKYIMK